MYNHEPENYRCPLCAIRNGVEGGFPYTKQADIIYQDQDLVAVIASHGWETNKGHVIVFPKKHVVNIYTIDDKILAKLHIFAKKVALAMKKEYGCEGITIRQNNEKPGDQDVWHFHLHVFPRYKEDNINQIPGLRKFSEPDERKEYASKLKIFLINTNLSKKSI